MPVAYAMFIIGFAGIGIMRLLRWLRSDYSRTVFFSMCSMAVAPMFILMGNIALYSGIGADVYNSCYKILGRYRGACLTASCLCFIWCSMWFTYCYSCNGLYSSARDEKIQLR